MSYVIKFAGQVGTAPGTTTLELGGAHMNPYQQGFVELRAPQLRARIRWDIIGLIGGGSLVIALTAGLIASALERR